MSLTPATEPVATPAPSATPPEPRLVSLADVGSALELADELFNDFVVTDLDSVTPTDFAIFIFNKGTPEDHVEALLALTPITRRVYDRWYESGGRAQESKRQNQWDREYREREELKAQGGKSSGTKLVACAE